MKNSIIILFFGSSSAKAFTQIQPQSRAIDSAFMNEYEAYIVYKNIKRYENNWTNSGLYYTRIILYSI